MGDAEADVGGALVHNSSAWSQPPPGPRARAAMMATESGIPRDDIRLRTSQATFASSA